VLKIRRSHPSKTLRDFSTQQDGENHYLCVCGPLANLERRRCRFAVDQSSGGPEFRPSFRCRPFRGGVHLSGMPRHTAQVPALPAHCPGLRPTARPCWQRGLPQPGLLLCRLQSGGRAWPYLPWNPGFAIWLAFRSSGLAWTGRLARQEGRAICCACWGGPVGLLVIRSLAIANTC